MKTTSALVFAVAGLAAAVNLHAQSTSPTPQSGTQLQRVAAFFGNWSYETETHATPLWPAARSTGTEVTRPLLDGFAAQTCFDEKTSAGETHFLELNWLDPKSKRLGYAFLGSDGFVETGTYAFEEGVDTWSWEGTFLVDGKPWISRGRGTLPPDHSSYIQEGEISPDGKSWHPAFTKRAKKVETPPTAALEAQLIALETGTWVAAKKHESFADVCLPTCTEIWGDGSVLTIQEVTAQLPDTEYLDYKLEDFQVSFPTENTALVRYRAWASVNYKGEAIPPRWMLATSVWVKTDGGWKAAWYQETPAPETQADTAAVEAELLRLENSWAAAYLARDVKALGEIEADDWICTTADGEVLSKADDIRDIANATYVATVFEMADLKVQVHGDTAVITGRQTEKATYKGEDASAVYRITDIWMRRHGRWQAIASHLCKVGTP